jgi:hypothetical protein
VTTKLGATLLALALATGCARVRPWERGRLASPVMQFQFDAAAEGSEASVVGITEGSTYATQGPGNAGAGCGCH